VQSRRLLVLPSVAGTIAAGLGVALAAAYLDAMVAVAILAVEADAVSSFVGVQGACHLVVEEAADRLGVLVLVPWKFVAGLTASMVPVERKAVLRGTAALNQSVRSKQLRIVFSTAPLLARKPPVPPRLATQLFVAMPLVLRHLSPLLPHLLPVRW
jgi:hypothetical protein